VRHKLDLLGLVISSSITALGGGIVRDVILMRTPFAFNEYYPAITVFATIFIALLFRRHLREELERQWLFVLSDTIGLVAFSITGALLAIEHDFNFFGVLILSFLTAVGGGVLRDTMINQIPSVLISDFYGSIALIVAILLLMAHSLWDVQPLSVALIATFAIGLRLLAYTKQWHLPKLNMENQ
ncbi:MAG: trimeric intracellular cation channel family protein, partial [Sulfuricurvum sp.]